MGDFTEARKKALEMSAKDGWIRFVHDGYVPAYTSEEKNANINYAKENSNKHCAVCLNVNGCCFAKDKMPVYPHHPNCHCKIEPVKNLITVAECDIRKFTEYLFNPEKYGKNGKFKLFIENKYDIMDSEWLREEYISQANEKYSKGDYRIGKLDEHGQRISIDVSLSRKDGSGKFYVTSGWMVYPDGRIRLSTIFAGDPRENHKERS